MDLMKKLNVEINTDGTVTRHDPFLHVPATGDCAPAEAVSLSKDIPLDPSKKTFVRLYLPRSIESSQRLPIVVYFHGGGFVLHSAATSYFDAACSGAAATLSVIFASVEFRLAPENRLPAAYDDAMDALCWLQGQAKAVEGEGTAEPWLARHGDFSRCYLMGSSSGGNMVYQVAVRALSTDLSPLCIEGLVLDQPFFSGVERSDSELRGVNDPIVPLALCDLMWELALPEGADRDHEYGNPVAHRRRVRGSSTPRMEMPRCLIRGHAADPLIDRVKDLAKMLEDEEGSSVVLRIHDGGCHGVEIMDPGKMKLWVEDLGDFLKSAQGSGLPA